MNGWLYCISNKRYSPDYISYSSSQLAGAPRRVFDHPDAFAGWNALASYGSIVSLLSVLLLAGPISLVPQHKDTVTPSTASSLEWLLPATPANHTFNQLPVLRTTVVH